MDNIVTIFNEKPELESPILIEGLPGVGNVGKLAAEHLVEQLKATKFADIYSKFFPPQVLLDDDGIIRLVSNEMYYCKGVEGRPDLMILIGDYQGLTPDGQYELSDHILNLAQEYNVSRVYTLGGYGVGKMVEKPRVLGAATDMDLVVEMKEKGVIFSKGEPGSGIVGASGLLLGLGKVRGMKAVCLMGETSGYFVDPKGAEAVLRILTKLVGADVDFKALEEKAEQIEALTSKIKETDQSAPEPRREDLGYIG
jgi:uncharacterized protein (TIGR00162 family)